MNALTYQEKIECLESKLEDVYEDVPLRCIKRTILKILRENLGDTCNAEKELCHALEILYEDVFGENPEDFYTEIM